MLDSGKPVVLAHGGFDPGVPPVLLPKFLGSLMLPAPGDEKSFLVIVQVEKPGAPFDRTAIGKRAVGAKVDLKALRST